MCEYLFAESVLGEGETVAREKKSISIGNSQQKMTHYINIVRF